ncbi:MAG: GNAT family N-acetyltransferase [Pseudomonadota bacterium]
MTAATPPVLETERLRLRGYVHADFRAFADYFESERSIYTDGPVSRAVAWDLFASGLGRWGLVGYGAWSLERKSDGVCIGLVSLNAPAVIDEPELGWILYEPFEGSGYAEEAAKCALAYAFETLGWTTLVSGIHLDNDKSVRLAGRLGGRIDPDVRVPSEPQTLIFRYAPPLV